MNRLITLFVLLLTNLVIAQETEISGIVLDTDMNNEPLMGATVVISGTTTGAQTDFDGNFTLTVTPGTYDLIFSYVGYTEIKKTIEIVAGENKKLSVPMSPSTLDAVVLKISKNRETVNALLLEQKKATIIKQAIGAQEMSNKGVSNAASAVSKISGVSKQEGSSSVYVRGLGDRYLNTTLNGLSIPSNNVENKNIDLKLFSSDVIKNVAISKAYNANLYADFAAGNIDVSSKEHSGKGYFNASVGTGFNSNAVDKTFMKSDGTGSLGFYTRYEHNPFNIVLSHGVDPIEGGTPINSAINVVGGKSFTFKNDSKLSLFATAAFDTDYKYQNGQEANYAKVYNKRFSEYEEFTYSTTTNAMANLTYKINGDHQFSYNSIFINSSSDAVGYYGIDGNGFQKDAIDGYYQMNTQFNQDKVFINQLLGKHRLSDNTKVNWAVGYNQIDASQPDRKRITLTGFEKSLDNDPATNPIFFTNNIFDNQRYFQDIDDRELTSRVELSHKLSDNVKLNLGFNGKSKERTFESFRYGYNIEPNTEINDVNNINSILNVSNLGTIFNTYVLEQIAGLGFVNAPGRYEDTYTGKLDALAGYTSAEIKVGEKLSIVPGIRLENINQEVTYDVQNLAITDPGFVAAKESLILPSLNTTFALNDEQNIRFSFSNTASLPEIKEAAPFVYVGVTDRIGGNPDVLGANGNASYSKVFNYDLKYEWFIDKGEIFSVGGFYKEIKNPINLVTAVDATGTDRFFRTGDQASVMGIELEARKVVFRNQDEDPEVTVGANVTVMKTTQDLKDSQGFATLIFKNRNEDELQGASPVLVNADINYAPEFNNWKPKANLVFSYFSDRIYALGSGDITNKVEKGFTTLDFILRNKISDKFDINFSVKNLLDPNISIIRENTEEHGDVILSKYKKGINIGLQLKYKF